MWSYFGEGVLDLNLYGGVPTKKIFYPGAELLPPNDTLFQKKSVLSILQNTNIEQNNDPI